MAGDLDPYRYQYECYFCGRNVNSRRTALIHRCRQNLIDRPVFIIKDVTPGMTKA